MGVCNNSQQMFILPLWSVFVQCLGYICPTMDTFCIAIRTYSFISEIYAVAYLNVIEFDFSFSFAM